MLPFLGNPRLFLSHSSSETYSKRSFNLENLSILFHLEYNGKKRLLELLTVEAFCDFRDILPQSNLRGTGNWIIFLLETKALNQSRLHYSGLQVRWRAICRRFWLVAVCFSLLPNGSFSFLSEVFSHCLKNIQDPNSQ